MTKISQYQDAIVNLNDRLLGTDSINGNATKNFPISEIVKFVSNRAEMAVVLSAFSIAAAQEPALVDTPLQVEAGAAQFGVDDPVMLAADGTITFNQIGLYVINTSGIFRRTGSSAGTAIVHFRGLLNSVQFGNTQTIELDRVDIWIPYERANVLYINTPGTELTFEIARDSGGVNAGGLAQAPMSLALGWSESPSFGITIQKYGV
jgi:hypothetical protein